MTIGLGKGILFCEFSLLWKCSATSPHLFLIPARLLVPQILMLPSGGFPWPRFLKVGAAHSGTLRRHIIFQNPTGPVASFIPMGGHLYTGAISQDNVWKGYDFDLKCCIGARYFDFKFRRPEHEQNPGGPEMVNILFVPGGLCVLRSVPPSEPVPEYPRSNSHCWNCCSPNRFIHAGKRFPIIADSHVPLTYVLPWDV